MDGFIDMAMSMQAPTRTPNLITFAKKRKITQRTIHTAALRLRLWGKKEYNVSRAHRIMQWSWPLRAAEAPTTDRRLTKMETSSLADPFHDDDVLHAAATCHPYRRHER